MSHFSQKNILRLNLFCLILMLASSCNLFRYGIEERKKEKNTATKIENENKSDRLKKAEIVLKFAQQYEGTPYLLGGETKKGIDCSALVMLSYKNIGLNLPRTSFEQSKVGKMVQPENALPGDLIFFKFKKSKSSNPVNHVGIVSKVSKTGEIYFFHASNSLGVTESSLEEPYYKEVFVKLMRVY